MGFEEEANVRTPKEIHAVLRSQIGTDVAPTASDLEAVVPYWIHHIDVTEDKTNPTVDWTEETTVFTNLHTQ